MAKEVVGKIYRETNYSVFKRLYDNRDVLQRRVDMLMESMSEGFIPSPILVNERMEIIDGQGRFEACKEMQLPIYYYMIPGIGSEECRRLNQYNSRWTLTDFVDSFAKSGNPNYRWLQAAMEETGLSVKRALRLAGHSASNTRGSISPLSAFRRGFLIFTEDDYAKVIDLKAKADEIVEALQYNSALNDAFYTAVKISTEYPGYNHARMLQRCKQNRDSFSLMAKEKAQLAEFERIYNYHAKKPVYFTDYYRDGKEVALYKAAPHNDKDISTLKGGIS